MKFHALARFSLVSLLSMTLVVGCSDDGNDEEPDDTPDVSSDTGTDTASDLEDAALDTVVADGDTDTGGNNATDPVACEAVEDLPSLTTSPLVEGYTFERPVFMTQSPGDDETFYVVERAGRILVVQDGEVREEPFLDIRDRVVSEYGEQGLLGLAFHPNYEENGRFFIDYTSAEETRNVVAEYQRSEDNELRANPEEVRRLVDVEDPEKEHNGGTITFGPDGYLYASLGNGGANQHDNEGVGNAQLTDNVFGTIMRLDVDAAERDFAAEGNPFVGGEGDDRIWLYGLRNPWRFSFDRATGDLFIADVGDREREEIDFVPADSEGGENFGWPAYEGTQLVREDVEEEIEEYTPPIYDYELQSPETRLRSGCAAIGGHVYRGDEIPALQGYYLHGDLCSSDIAAMRYCAPEDGDGEREIVDHRRLPGLEAAANGLGGIAEDNAGNLYLIYHAANTILRIESSE